MLEGPKDNLQFVHEANHDVRAMLVPLEGNELISVDIFVRPEAARTDDSSNVIELLHLEDVIDEPVERFSNTHIR